MIAGGSEFETNIGAATTKGRRVSAGGTGPVDAAAVTYRPLATTPLPTSLPPRAQQTVADKLDTSFLSVLDFIPKQLHASIRLNKRWGSGATDVTKYFQVAIDFVNNSAIDSAIDFVDPVINIPAGCYFVGNLVLRDGIKLRGEHLNNTMLVPVPGTKGSWLKNVGNAAKITLERIRFYGHNEPGITAGIDFGSLQNGGCEWGTYCDMRDLEISHLPNAIGLKLQANVGVLYNVWTEQTVCA